MTKKKESNQEDKKIWENYIKNPSDIYDKDQGASNSIQRRERYKFDLHGFSLDQANNKVKEIIKSCYERNCREILLITGKGLHSNHDDVYKSSDFSKLRFSVPEFVNSDPEISKMILSIGNPSQREGGEGVLLIKAEGKEGKIKGGKPSCIT